MTAAVIAVSVAAYLAGMILTARWKYAQVRPWTEPLACTTPYSCESSGHHDSSCYRRPGTTLIDSQSQALQWALLIGVIWFAVWPCLAVAAAVMAIGRLMVSGAARETPEEIEVKTEWLEAENDRLRRQGG